MNAGFTVTICKTCGRPFTPEAPQSLKNPMACVPCEYGLFQEGGGNNEVSQSLVGRSEFPRSADALLNPFPNGRWS